MELCPYYRKPVVEYESKLNRDLWQPTVKLYEEKKYEECFLMLLRYINSEAAETCEKEPSHWVIPHGSLTVEIQITKDGMLEITAPFLKLPAERRAPLLRQVLELNTMTLTLPKLELKDDDFTFVYRTPLALADPFKIYGVLFEICIYGDSFDDEFISKFGAVPLREKEVTFLPKEQVDQAWQGFQDLLAEGRQFGDYYTSKRWYGFAFEMQGIALMRIDHMIAPQGYLRTRLERSINHVWDQRSTEEITNALARDVDEYRQLDRAVFEGDFYKTSFFVSAKKSAEIAACQKNMNQRWEWAKEDRARSSGLGVAVCYLFAAYNALYSFFVPAVLRNELVTTLTAMGGKTWEEAGDLAWTSFQKIMDPAFE
jgi:hypothetical protein